MVTELFAQRPISISAAAVNAKEAHPVGVGEAHLIEAGTDITYTIFFQNNGADTAYNVKILDTLSNNLDVSSIRKEGSSHMNDFSIINENVLKVSFANIRLPNISINETTSRGFISFTISTKEDLPLGSIILNDAAIAFDFNPPIITNTVYHSIGENVVSGTNTANFNDQLNIYPNPIVNKATVDVGEADFQSGKFLIYDASGKLTFQHTFTSPQFEMDRSDLPSGKYFYQLLLDGHPVSSGKLLLQ